MSAGFLFLTIRFGFVLSFFEKALKCNLFSFLFIAICIGLVIT